MNRSHPPLALAVQAAKAVGHPARLRLLSMLGGGPLCVCQMTAVLGLAPSTVSGHLLELRRGGLVAEEKHGKWVEYRLRTDGPYGRLIEETLALLAGDPAIAADRVRIRQVTAVPVEILCRTDSKVPKVRASTRKRSAPGRTPGSPPIHKKGAGT